MERRFFSGNTIEQAVMAAARHFELDPSELAYSLRDKKHGFLNIRRRVVIEVDPSAPAKPPSAPPEPLSVAGPERAPTAGPPIAGQPTAAARPAAARPVSVAVPVAAQKETFERRSEVAWPHRPEDVAEEFAAELAESGERDREIAAFEKALEEVAALLGVPLEGTVRRGDGPFEIELSSADRDFLVAEDGKVLRAVEHLLPRLIRGLLGGGLPCTVDCDGFRASRDLELRELAGGMAELARRQGRAKKLEPMNPADRRVVHMALAEDPTVRTESEGNGYMKRVKILPV